LADIILSCFAVSVSQLLAGIDLLNFQLAISPLTRKIALAVSWRLLDTPRLVELGPKARAK